MPDEPSESTTSNFAAMGGSSPLDATTADHLAQLDATMQSAADAANAEAARAGDTGVAGPRIDLWGLSDKQKIDRLDDIMDQARIAADAQAELERDGYDVESGDDLSALDADDGEDLEDDEDLVGDDDAHGDDGEEGAGSDEQTAPRRWTRKEAERVANELAEAKAQLSEHHGELERIHQSDQHILRELGQISGYVKESNGRFRYENLTEKVLKGTATAAERRECNEMTQWHDLAAPIFREATRQFESTRDQFIASVGTSWRQTMTSAVRAEKLDDSVAERIYNSPEPIRTAIQIGREIERKARQPKPATKPTTPAARTQSRSAPPAQTPPRPKGEPGWLGDAMANLDEQMRISEIAANKRRDREQAELEDQARRRRRSVA